VITGVAVFTAIQAADVAGYSWLARVEAPH
jgi:hypothetical protein